MYIIGNTTDTAVTQICVQFDNTIIYFAGKKKQNTAILYLMYRAVVLLRTGDYNNITFD